MSKDDSNFLASASIEETNAMRIKLGLKPLLVKESDANVETVEAPQDGKKEEVIKSVRDELISGEGLAEKISRGKRIATNRHLNIDEDEDIDTSDLMAWAQKMSKINAQKLKQREMAVSYSDDEDEDEANAAEAPRGINDKMSKAKPKLKVIHKIDELTVNAKGGDGVVLTLADVGVLEAQEAGVADVDFLENVEISAKKRHALKQRMFKESQGEYVPFEDEEELNVDAAADYQDGKRNILKHYDDKIAGSSDKRLKNLTKDGFFLDGDLDANEKQDLDVKVNGAGMEPAEEQSLVLGTIKKRKFLNQRKNRKVDWNEVFGVADANATKNDETYDANDDTAANDVETHVKPLTKEAIVEDEQLEMDALYRQVARHRARYATIVKHEHEELQTSVVDTGVAFDEDAKETVEITPTSEFCNAVSITNAVAMETLAHENGLIQPPNSPVDADCREPKADEVESEAYSEQPLSTGLAQALNLLREKGEFRFDEESKKRKLEDIGKDINLHYIDSYGRQMTPKEAFRQISWTFHGKGPGLNKQELKLKRMERERLAKADSVSNSVVMKALTSHQKQTKTPFLVLQK